jgi:serine/threonine protein kinase
MFEPGQLLQERYQLQYPLRRSPQARQTWLATDLAADPHELVVIKLLVFTEMKWQELKLFEREAQVLKQLTHPRIPRYRDYFLFEQHLNSRLCWWGLVQDYVLGRSLQDLLEQGTRWSEPEIRQLAKDMLQILNYLHRLSPPIFHRDIKPSNLVLDQAQQVWLVDFGAVQNQTAMTGVSFTVVGSYGYTPIEQFGGRCVPASDLYALGATLIHLLTGMCPADLLQQNLRIQFRDRINTDSNLIRWIEKLVEPALEKRFRSALEALEALERGIDSEITPIRDSIQTVCSTQSKRIQRISPHLVVEQISPQVLKIKVRECSPNLSNSSLPFAFYLFYFAWAFIAFTLLTFIGAAYAFTLAFILAYLISISTILWEARGRKIAPGNSIQFDKRCDHFAVTSRSHFSMKRYSEAISAIRYLSISSSQALTPQNPLHTVWAVTIRANQNYTLNWKLTEEESIWLVNEIQSWLNAKK